MITIDNKWESVIKKYLQKYKHINATTRSGYIYTCQDCGLTFSINYASHVIVTIKNNKYTKAPDMYCKDLIILDIII